MQYLKNVRRHALIFSNSMYNEKNVTSHLAQTHRVNNEKRKEEKCKKVQVGKDQENAQFIVSRMSSYFK